MAARERRYLSFLLRLWCTDQDGNETWRTSLEDPRTGEKRSFASLGLMVDYLKKKTQRIAWDEQDNQIFDTTDEST